jgi:hypothetical protein
VDRFKKPLVWGLMVVAVCFGLWQRHLREGHRFAQFWAPINNQSKPVLVSVGTQTVWGLSRRLSEEFLRKSEGSLDVSRDTPRFPAGAMIQAEDLVAFTDDRFTSGDMEATIRITQLMDRSGKATQFRLGNGISEEESKQQPIILVGAFSNPWTLEWSQHLRFYFHRELNQDGVRVSIRDRKNTNNIWSVPYLARDRMTEDYAIVSRVVDPLTHNVVIAIAGITHYGTQAAAEFVTDEGSMEAALLSAPRGWQDRNLEAVVETAVINRMPSRTRVVQLAVW